MSEYVPRLVHLPGTVLTPEVVLHRTLDKVEHIHAIVVTIVWKNGQVASDWSQMKVSELCMALLSLDEQARREFFDRVQPR